MRNRRIYLSVLWLWYGFQPALVLDWWGKKTNDTLMVRFSYLVEFTMQRTLFTSYMKY